MNTPQERIAEYLQKHYSGGEGWPPMHHAGEICKLFAPSITGLEVSCALKTELLRAVRYSMDRDVPFPSLEKITEAINDTGGKELLERLDKLEDRLKTAVGILQMTLTPFETPDIQHLFYERRDKFLASVEGKV